jgi:uncharacterized protein YecT (DUF1311 family)
MNDSRLTQGDTYNGFSVPGTRRADAPTPSSMRQPRRAWNGHIALILSLALVGGTALGLSYRTLSRETHSPVAASQAAVAARSAELPATPARSTSEAPLAPPAPVETSSREPARPQIFIPPARKEGAITGPPAVQHSTGPAFNCGGALRRSERMICNDPVLSELDRRLNRSFTRAVRAGAPRAELRAIQDDWVFRRETVARHSAAALADYYRARIRQLDALAENPALLNQLKG